MTVSARHFERVTSEDNQNKSTPGKFWAILLQGILTGGGESHAKPLWIALWTPSKLPFITPLGEAADRVSKAAEASMEELENGSHAAEAPVQSYAELIQSKIGATAVIVAPAEPEWPDKAYDQNSLIKVSVDSDDFPHSIYVLPPVTWFKAGRQQAEDPRMQYHPLPPNSS